MRPRINTQDEFEFLPSNLKLTNDYYAKYQAISAILDENPEIMDAIHRDLASALEEIVAQDKRGAKYKFTSDTILPACGVSSSRGAPCERSSFASTTATFCAASAASSMDR